jgi:RNA polymerase sigma-70 factor, ECF subfamily
VPQSLTDSSNNLDSRGAGLYERLVAELAELARLAQAGEKAARDELLAELYKIVRKQVFFTIGGGPLAEDAVQETMIALYRGLPAFRGEAHPRTWAITIAMRTAQKLRRRESRHIPVEEVDTAIFDTDMAAAGELVALQAALTRLSPKKRDAFVLMSLLELTAEEAGKALGTFANTAASRNRHACTELAKYFDESAPARGTHGERTAS